MIHHKSVYSFVSRRQAKWMRSRFLSDCRESPPVYRVDSSDPARWREDCLEPAVRILSAYLEGSGPPAHPAPLARFSVADSHVEELRKSFHCDICQRDFQGSRQYSAHLAGSRHHKVCRSQKTVARPPPRLVLTQVGPNCSRQEAARLLKKALGLPLSEVLAAMEQLPSNLGQVGPWPKAEGLVKSLVLRGIAVELVSEEEAATVTTPNSGLVDLDCQQLNASQS